MHTLGADPEVFVTQNGKVIPVVGRLGGTKDEPVPFRKLSPDYCYQEDGVVAEFNIPPSTSMRTFEASINTAKELLNEKLSKQGLGADYSFSSYKFSNFELSSPQAQRLGCDPDFCAYNDKGAPAETARKAFKAEDLGNYRHTGGHLHFGYDKDVIPEHAFVNLVDLLVYLPLLDYDKQTQRRAFYGRAGLYRPKSYGIEYRSMSNFWLSHPGLTSIVASQAFRMLSVLAREDTSKIAAFYRRVPWPRVWAIINTGVTADNQKEYISLFNSINKIADDTHCPFFYDSYSVAALNGLLIETGERPFYDRHPNYAIANGMYQRVY